MNSRISCTSSRDRPADTRVFPFRRHDVSPRFSKSNKTSGAFVDAVAEGSASALTVLACACWFAGRTGSLLQAAATRTSVNINVERGTDLTDTRKRREFLSAQRPAVQQRTPRSRSSVPRPRGAAAQPAASRHKPTFEWTRVAFRLLQRLVSRRILGSENVQVVENYGVPISTRCELELRRQIGKRTIQRDIVVEPESARIELAEARVRMPFRRIGVRERGRTKLRCKASIWPKRVSYERRDGLPSPPSPVTVRLIDHP